MLWYVMLCTPAWYHILLSARLLIIAPLGHDVLPMPFSKLKYIRFFNCIYVIDTLLILVFYICISRDS